MPTTHARWSCDICQTMYDTLKEAQECEAKGREQPICNVGDFVTTGQTFGWHEGDPRWLFSRVPMRDCASGFQLVFIYVVTSITPDPRDKHRLRYSLRTFAMNEATGYWRGCTGRDHYMPEKLSDAELKKHVSDDMRTQAKSVLGEVYENIL